ncbi:MAG: oligosaccharide flippase family protein [Bacteroidota bacterium]
MKNKTLINFFSSGIQAIAVQVLGVVFFYIISLYLSKNDFGLISWANAVSIFATTVLSFGLEQIVVRRVASSSSSDWAAAAYLWHALIGSTITLLLLFCMYNFMSEPSSAIKYLLWFFIAQSVIYIGVPLKQYLNAKEIFTPYAIIAFFSNVCKVGLVLMLVYIQRLTINNVAYILIICAGIEFVSLIIYIINKTDFHFLVKITAYKKLLKEAAPQYLSVLFDSSLSRMDWILLGVLSTKAITADYSFAYRAYEIARLPLLVIAPLIMPKFARLLSSRNGLDTDKQSQISSFFTIEMFLSIIITLVLNILWSPFIDHVTNGKYGFSNSIEFMILSLCIPLQFFMNLLWTLCFTSRMYKPISIITVVSAIGNIFMNLILIPLYKGEGAALAYFFTTLFQLIGYYILVRKHIMSFPIISFGILLVIGVIVYFVSSHIGQSVILQVLLAVVLFTLISVALKQITKNHISILQLYLKR